MNTPAKTDTSNLDDAFQVRSKHLPNGGILVVSRGTLKKLGGDKHEVRKLAHLFVREWSTGPCHEVVSGPDDSEFCAWAVERLAEAKRRKEQKATELTEKRLAKAERAVAAIRAGRKICSVNPSLGRLVGLKAADGQVTHLSDGHGLWAIEAAPKKLAAQYAAVVANGGELPPVNSDFTYSVYDLETTGFGARIEAAEAADSTAIERRCGEKLEILGVAPGTHSDSPMLIFHGAENLDLRIGLDSRLVGSLQGATLYGNHETSPVTIMREGGRAEIIMPMRLEAADLESFLPAKQN